MPDFYVQVSIFILLVLSLGLHEAAHARVASFFGDTTPANDGVNTWNPIPHIRRAFISCVVLPALTWFSWGFFIGGAFVMLNPALMRPRRLGYFCAVAAGPGMNFLLALLLGVAGILTVVAQGTPLLDKQNHLNPLVQVLFTSASFNFLLGIFNLIPMPPLDGAALASTVFPALRPIYQSIGGFGFLILILALNFSGLSYYLFYPVTIFQEVLVFIAYLVAPH